MHNTVRERPDWCISRQRAWGVPIPVFYCADCEEPYATKETLARIAEIFREEGADSWYRREEAHFLPPGAACPKCGHKKFRREEDILDVWFDSGSSSLTVLEAHPDLHWPADVYLEGTDQYRGWFNSSLMVALRARGEAPYRTVVTHGFTVDEQGHKMSKSLGNFIAPQEVEEKYGAEILRLWVAMTDYRSDMAVSHAMLGRCAESYRKIRNTCRYLLGNLFDYEPGSEGEELEPLDQWALTRLGEFEKTMRRAYAAYEFHRAYHLLVNFCSVDLSAQYFDILKDRLYCSLANAPERRSAQFALHRIGASLARLMAPILPFTAEEVWEKLPAKEGREESVHLSTFEAFGLERDDAFRTRWDNLFRLRDDALKALELARAQKAVGNSLAAKIALTWDGAPPDWVRETENFLPALFIVSQVENGSDENPPQREPAHKSENFPGLSVRVLPAEGEKCSRCWMYSPSVGGDSEHPGVCARCVGVLGELDA
jgi:isoleucyl-tRNA synthetase